MSLALHELRTLSQQVANVGIAAGLAALLIELLGLWYAIAGVGANPLSEAPLELLLLPPWLTAAGFAVEHLLHPGPQEEVRAPIRTALMSVAAVGVLWAVFGVLKIHMLVFTSIAGFLLFVGLSVGVFWFLIRRAV